MLDDIKITNYTSESTQGIRTYRIGNRRDNPKLTMSTRIVLGN